MKDNTNIGENGLWKEIPEGINQTFFNSLVVNNNGESTLHTINNKYEEIELPILVVGMPKVGTTSITEFFECSGRYKVSHHQCKGRGGHGRCGVLIRDNVMLSNFVVDIDKDYLAKLKSELPTIVYSNKESINDFVIDIVSIGSDKRIDYVSRFPLLCIFLK